jgi:hypothetical protein
MGANLRRLDGARRAARAVQISSDTYRFLMRPGIAFHDGSPHRYDVAFSLKILKERAAQSRSNCCATLSARKQPMTRPWWFVSARDGPLFAGPGRTACPKRRRRERQSR